MLRPYFNNNKSIMINGQNRAMHYEEFIKVYLNWNSPFKGAL